MSDGVQFTQRSAQRIADVVREFEAESRDVLGLYGTRRSRGPSIHWRHGYNASGVEIPPHSCVAIAGGSTLDGLFHANMYRPSTEFFKSYGFTGSQAIPAHETGGYHLEHWLATYDSGTPAAEEGWGPRPGQFTLSKGYPGVVINSLRDSTNRIVEVAHCFPLTVLLGKTTGSVTANSSTTSWAIYAGTLGSESTTSFSVPSAYSRIAIASGKWIKATWINNGWHLEPLEC